MRVRQYEESRRQDPISRCSAHSRVRRFKLGAPNTRRGRRVNPASNRRPPDFPGDRISPRERFLVADQYRVDREWKRYEGTPQRDLWRELRVRFLSRHASPDGWTLEVGCGPGRFSRFVGGPTSRRVLVDLSERMLRRARKEAAVGRNVGSSVSLVRGDGKHLPFRGARFDEVVLFGNMLGYALNDAFVLLERTSAALAPGGIVVVEVAPGAGERSRYFHRLPSGAVRRMLRSPLTVISRRVVTEGFDGPSPSAQTGPGFRRISAEELTRSLELMGLTILETMAVAPVLGLETERIAAVARDPLSWRRLIELEETFGRIAERFSAASAVLVAACLTKQATMIK